MATSLYKFPIIFFYNLWLRPKRLWATLLCWVVVVSVHAQQYNSLKTIGGPIFDQVNGIDTATNGGLYVAGEFESTVNFGNNVVLQATGNKDAYLMRTDSAFNALWAVKLGDGKYERCNKVSTLPNGGAVVAGHFYQKLVCQGDTLTAKGENDAFVAAFDSTGNLLWMEALGGAGRDAALAVAVTDSGFVYVTGFFNNPITTTLGLMGAGGNNFFVARYSNSGQLQWLRHGSYGNGSEPMAIAALPQGGVATAGFFTGNMLVNGIFKYGAGNTDAFLVGYGAGGNLLYHHTYGGSAYEFAMALQSTPSGDVVMAGSFNGALNIHGQVATTAGYLDVYTTRINPVAGSTVWLSVSQLSTNHSQANALTIGHHHAYVTGQYVGNTSFGTKQINGYGQNDVFVVAYNLATGQPTWAVGGGGSTDQAALTATCRPNQNQVIIGGGQNGTLTFGTLNTASKGSSDGFLLALTDTFTVLSTPQRQPPKPLKKLTVVPNPAGNHIGLQGLPSQPYTTANIVIYDMHGRIAKQLNQTLFNPNTTINIEALPPGVYTIRAFTKKYNFATGLFIKK